MKKILFLFFLILVSCGELYARAGGGIGGGRGGSGGGYSGGGYGHGGLYHHYGHGYNSYHQQPGDATSALLLFPAIAFALLFITFILYKLSSGGKQHKKAIQASQKFDTFWDEKNMKDFAREIFLKMQKVWMERDLKKADRQVSSAFMQKNLPIINHYKKKGLINIISHVNIKKITITDVHDNADDSKDSFAALIKAEMMDYLAYEDNHTRIVEGKDEIEVVSDLYIFTRKANRWILDEIINNPEDWQLKL